jgi:hypothetical protein
VPQINSLAHFDSRSAAVSTVAMRVRSIWVVRLNFSVRSIGVTVQALGLREPDDFNGVFEAMNREPPEAIP